MQTPTPFDTLISRAENLIDRLEAFLPHKPAAPDWSAKAFRWHKTGQQGHLVAISHVAKISFGDLHHIDEQKALLDQNTAQFVQKRSANHVLLTGARGTGKSSLIKACLNQYAEQGLRLIEVDKHHLLDLAEITALIQDRPERFILFCDDLSFEENETIYKALKVALDGSISAPAENLLIYATSNRRHLLPEYFNDNDGYRHDAKGEIHPSEAVEEKISLSERFGIWLSFYPFSQDDYLNIVAYWLSHMGCASTAIEQAKEEALIWALERGSRSGRIAWQFARHWAGKNLQAVS